MTGPSFFTYSFKSIYIGVFTYLWYDRICLLYQSFGKAPCLLKWERFHKAESLWIGWEYRIHRNIWLGKLTEYAINKDGTAGI